MSNSSELTTNGLSLPREVHALPLRRPFARRICLRLLANIEVGSLTLHDEGEIFHFGNAGDASQPHAEVYIHDSNLYRLMLSGGSIATGEAYMQGLWTSPDLVAVMRLFSANLPTLELMESKQSWLVRLGLKLSHTLNRNTRKGSRKNIAAHYDLGNDFFGLFLDPTMMYSAALFDTDATGLEDASVAKLDELCRQLELCEDDHLLEIGTGWGGMAIHAARNYGCRVTTTTISQEQYEYACEQVRKAGLQDRITLLCEDYRNLQGRFDKLVSVEMIEAVGHDFYSSYFQRCSQLLKPEGKMVIQAITIADQRYAAARDSVDFIQRYIFPGGSLPSVAVIADHLARDTDMQMIHLRDITRDYALTLSHWRERFLAAQAGVREMGFDQTFIRMWEFYLAYCEGGFRERIISTVQLAFAKPGYRFAAV
ncbi:MAG: class I SAM-dependent methyltransferase [Pseudomonadales bacterium]|nr:class I SAM-dependent methyltransferase [Pseudomonadales bacterium]